MSGQIKWVEWGELYPSRFRYFWGSGKNNHIPNQPMWVVKNLFITW